MWDDFLAAHALTLPVMAVLLTFSGFFSGSEAALFSLSPGQVYELTHRHRKMGRLVSGLLQRPRRLLNSILLGNLIVNIAYMSRSAILVQDLYARAAPTAVVVSATVVSLMGFILIGEVTPKMLAVSIAPRWSLLAAPPLAVMIRILWPVVWVIDRLFVLPLTRILAPGRSSPHVTSEELAVVLDHSRQQGLIPHDTGQMLREIMELTDLRAGDIMVPRVDMIAFDLSLGPEALGELFRGTHLRRLPVFEGDPDHIVGLIRARDYLLRTGDDLRSLVREVVFVPEEADLEKLLIQFRVRRAQLAIVVDEYGGTAGLVTMEDVLEEIVGEIPDAEGDLAEQWVHRLSEREYIVDADLGVRDLAEVLEVDLSGRRVSTIGGLLAAELGRLPRVEDQATCGNVRLTVQSIRRRRVGRVRVELIDPDAPDAEGAA